VGYINIETWEKVLRWAQGKFYGNEYLFQYVNVFEPSDLVQSYFLWRLRQDKTDDRYLFGDFREYEADLIRKAKKRHKVALTITNSQNLVLTSFDGNYRDDELIEGYIYRQTRGKRKRRSI